MQKSVVTMESFLVLLFFCWVFNIIKFKIDLICVFKIIHILYEFICYSCNYTFAFAYFYIFLIHWVNTHTHTHVCVRATKFFSFWFYLILVPKELEKKWDEWKKTKRSILEWKTIIVWNMNGVRIYFFLPFMYFIDPTMSTKKVIHHHQWQGTIRLLGIKSIFNV